ncbi:FHA domain-containing protein [uncultured Gulosibacter sp.]|uniref:FHA domain-containing protein n=1 Tax=uncultured Gulosibacter sp. TaxID=1339167 RepID=UPI00288C307A|nr:FHA domain-containing protein [uncultured Gulosibacter sp.]
MNTQQPPLGISYLPGQGTLIVAAGAQILLSPNFTGSGQQLLRGLLSGQPARALLDELCATDPEASVAAVLVTPGDTSFMLRGQARVVVTTDRGPLSALPDLPTGPDQLSGWSGGKLVAIHGWRITLDTETPPVSPEPSDEFVSAGGTAPCSEAWFGDVITFEALSEVDDDTILDPVPVTPPEAPSPTGAIDAVRMEPITSDSPIAAAESVAIDEPITAAEPVCADEPVAPAEPVDADAPVAAAEPATAAPAANSEVDDDTILDPVPVAHPQAPAASAAAPPSAEMPPLPPLPALPAEPQHPEPQSPATFAQPAEEPQQSYFPETPSADEPEADYVPGSAAAQIAAAQAAVSEATMPKPAAPSAPAQSAPAFTPAPTPAPAPAVPQHPAALATEPEVTGEPTFVPRLISNHGHTVPLEHPQVIGRKPSVDRAPDPHNARLIVVPSPNDEVSRSHCVVAYEHGSVLVWDLGSANGTRVLRSGSIPEQLSPMITVPIAHGDIIDLGDGATFWID